jgi:hypothetical protein
VDPWIRKKPSHQGVQEGTTMMNDKNSRPVSSFLIGRSALLESAPFAHREQRDDKIPLFSAPPWSSCPSFGYKIPVSALSDMPDSAPRFSSLEVLQESESFNHHSPTYLNLYK